MSVQGASGSPRGSMSTAPLMKTSLQVRLPASNSSAASIDSARTTLHRRKAASVTNTQSEAMQLPLPRTAASCSKQQAAAAAWTLTLILLLSAGGGFMPSGGKAVPHICILLCPTVSSRRYRWCSPSQAAPPRACSARDGSCYASLPFMQAKLLSLFE